MPTGKELEAAHLAKVTESWKSYGNVYWTSEEFSEDGAYGFDLSSESIGSSAKAMSGMYVVFAKRRNL